MTSDIAFECLLISPDRGVVCILDRLLRKFSISARTCLSVAEALEHISRASIDLVVVDRDDASNLFDGIRRSGTWHKPTVVAVSAFEYAIAGAHFVLRKPVTEESVTLSLKSVYSRMLCDYRRRTRYALMSAVRCTNDDYRSVDITITNIGDGGFGFISKEEITLGDILRLRLLPPGAARPISIEARVRWTRDYGVAGCEYLHIPPTDLRILDDWLRSKIQIKKPFAVV